MAFSRVAQVPTGIIMLRPVAFAAALLCVGCETPVAFTLPLPLGGSIVVPLQALDKCQWVHERRHQEQVLRMGTTRFLAAIAAEHIEHGRQCGRLEFEAWEAQWACENFFGNMTHAEKRIAMGCDPRPADAGDAELIQ